MTPMKKEERYSPRCTCPAYDADWDGAKQADCPVHGLERKAECESCGWRGIPEAMSVCDSCGEPLYCPLGCSGGHSHGGQQIGRHFRHIGPCSWHDGPCESPVWCPCPGEANRVGRVSALSKRTKR